MSTFHRYAYSAFIVTLVASLSAAAPPEKKLKMWLKISNQDAPLQMLGMKRELEPSYEPAVHYRNTSSKETVGMLISVLIRDLDGKVGSTQSNADGEYPTERKIAPGDDIWAREPALESTSLWILLKNPHTPCADARVVLERVTFADGTTWQRDRNKETDLWPDLHATSDPECKSTDLTDEERSELTSMTYDRTWSKEIEEEYAKETNEYLFVCGIRPLGRGLAAVCPR